MAQEIELKLAMAGAGWRTFSRHPLLREAIAPPHTQTLRNLYFDTPDLALRRRRVALRLRRAGRRWLQTVKCASASSAGLSSRPEWEHPFSGHFDFSAIDDPALRTELETLRDRGVLVTVFDTTFERREWRFRAGDGELLLMADRGHIIAGERREIISELELELAGAPVATLLDFAARLAATLPLRTEARSKAQRGYDLMTGATLEPVRAGRSPVDPDGSAVDAFRAIALDCIAHYQANEHGALHSDAPEFIHQMRVALRRLRSALRVFAPALPADETSALTPMLRDLAVTLGELRDHDVLLAEVVAPVLKESPSAAMADLDDRLRTTRGAVRERVVAALQDGRQARLMIALLGVLQRLHDHRSERGLAALAHKRLAHAHERLLTAARHAKSGDIADLHALRIDVKRLRYAVEFTLPVLHGKRAQRMLDTLAAAQEQLGFINDLSQAGPRLLAAAADDASRMAAVALVATHHMKRYRKVVDDAPKLLKQLARLPRPR